MKKSTVQYILALVICFAVGCGIALGLNAYDKNAERITPISGGQTIDFSAYGFTLTVPDDFAMNDYTTNNASEGGNALFAGCAYGEIANCIFSAIPTIPATNSGSTASRKSSPII